MKPIKYFLDKSLEPDFATKEQIVNLAQEKEIFQHIAVMPDVHSKKGRKCPTGVVAATRNKIFPQILDTAPNCGMRILATAWKKKDLTKKNIDDLFLELVKNVPTKTYWGNFFSKKTIIDICRFGNKALLSVLKSKEQELTNSFQQGNFFQKIPTQNEILNAIPHIFFNFAQFRLGILGEAGNHFLDLMLVEDLLDKEKAKVLNLEKDQYLFLMHTGSGVFGQYASYFFTPKEEEHLSMKIITNLGRLTFRSNLLNLKEILTLQKKVKLYRKKSNFFPINPYNKLGQAYLTSHFASANFGFANRMVITKNIATTIKNILPKKNPHLNLIYDLPHISVAREKHFNQEVWVHRNGASRGFGPSRMHTHSIFSQTGELGILAGSMNASSYLVGALDKNDATFYSINHGAGKTKKYENSAPKNKEELIKIMEQNEVRLYNAKSKGVIQQAGACYKDIDQILKTVSDFNIAKPIAKLKPIAVLMA